jgi:hypothetical protein
MRHAYYNPDGKIEDAHEMVGKNGRVCDLLKNLELLQCEYDQALSNKLCRLMHNDPSIVADFSPGRKKKDDEDGEEVWERDPDQAPADIQKYLMYVMCDMINESYRTIEYSRNLRT